MKLLVCIALACAPLLADDRAALSPEDALKSFQLADPAMRVELVAAEPLVESPCAIAFDEKGRLFVAENRGYPNTAEPPQGRIALLVDADGDGRMDTRTTFADGLTFPNGVLPWQGGIVVTCAPDVIFLKDTDFETGKAMGRIWRVFENGAPGRAPAFGVRQPSGALESSASTKDSPQPADDTPQSGRGLPQSKASGLAALQRVIAFGDTPGDDALRELADPAIRERAAKAFAASTPGDRQAAFEKAKAVLALTADAKQGRELFKAQCATCHRLDREGSAVGPDLLDMRNQPKESILFHILVPDAEVAPAFAAYLAEATDGRSILGVLASETTNSITLRGPLAQDTTLLRSDVKKLDALPNSLMPSGLEAAMSQQDLADLLAYLKGEK